MKTTDDAVVALGFPLTQHVDARTIRLVQDVLTQQVLTNPDIGEEGAECLRGFVSLLHLIELVRPFHERNREVRRAEGMVARVTWERGVTAHNNGDTPITEAGT